MPAFVLYASRLADVSVTVTAVLVRSIELDRCNFTRPGSLFVLQQFQLSGAAFLRDCRVTDGAGVVYQDGVVLAGHTNWETRLGFISGSNMTNGTVVLRRLRGSAVKGTRVTSRAPRRAMQSALARLVAVHQTPSTRVLLEDLHFSYAVINKYHRIVVIGANASAELRRVNFSYAPTARVAHHAMTLTPFPLASLRISAATFEMRNPLDCAGGCDSQLVAEARSMALVNVTVRNMRRFFAFASNRTDLATPALPLPSRYAICDQTYNSSLAIGSATMPNVTGGCPGLLAIERECARVRAKRHRGYLRQRRNPLRAPRHHGKR